MVIGVISDTHNKFDPAIRTHFAGVSQILHAGDIGERRILQELEAIAPVLAVTGNVDWGGPLDRDVPRSRSITLDGCPIYMTHIVDHPAQLLKRLPEPRPAVYIYGHSHIPLIEEHEAVLFLNPGSAGPGRFGRERSIARLTIMDGKASAELIPL
jgi:putative phosphoesterase